jgi:hypothetical protein
MAFMKLLVFVSRISVDALLLTINNLVALLVANSLEPLNV